MRRTQLYIDEETYRILKRESRLKKVSLSELVRQAVRESLRRREEALLSGIEKVAGIWKDRDFDVDDYIKERREDRKVGDV